MWQDEPPRHQEGAYWLLNQNHKWSTMLPIIMAMQEAQILHFENNAITEISYTETPHYQLTKAFMDNPERYLRELEG